MIHLSEEFDSSELWKCEFKCGMTFESAKALLRHHKIEHNQDTFNRSIT